jgi:hypothetical protein
VGREMRRTGEKLWMWIAGIQEEIIGARVVERKMENMEKLRVDGHLERTESVSS